MVKNNKLIKETTEELFKLLQIDGKFEINEDKEQIGIVLETNDTGIVIGYHGDTLDSLQFILSLCLAEKLGEFKRVSLEVGDYRKNREDWLRSLAEETKEKALSQNREVELMDLKPWERRIVHMIFQDDNEVLSESVGEGKDRVLVVKPKN